MKTIWLCAAITMGTFTLAAAQDTTSAPIREGDPAVRQTPDQLQQSMLKDMVKITSAQLPEGVKEASSGDDFQGSKTYYKHRNKDEYAVEVKNGEVSSFHFFDKEGKLRKP